MDEVSAWSAGVAWIDGRYCPIGEAKISVLDLGVTRSDGSYDVVHVWDGRFYRLTPTWTGSVPAWPGSGSTPGTAGPRSRPSCTVASAGPGCGRRTCR